MQDSTQENLEDKKSEEMRKTKNKLYTTQGGSFYSDKTSVFGFDPVEKNRKRILKKILVISSIDKEVQKLLVRFVSIGPKACDESSKKKLLANADQIMDKDRLKILEGFIEKIGNGDCSYENIMEVFKFFILSPIEKQYIEKIDAEITESQRLDEEISKVNQELKTQKEKKGRIKPVKESVEGLLKEIEIYDNKIEKANQKLNENIAHNEQLREKINQLRKEKTVIEKLHEKLKQELEIKQQTVENTIKNAGEAYIQRNLAEEQLRTLHEKAERQKQEFIAEIQDINKNIMHDKKFKEFIKSKHKEKEELENLEKAILKNQKKIEEKQQSNEIMESEYQLSAKKEEEIKEAFQRIKDETKINEPEELLTLFKFLNEKNSNMEKFVSELTKELEDLETNIKNVKEEIVQYQIKGASTDTKKREKKLEIMKKIQNEQKKKALTKMQYEKALETLSMIKNLIESVLISVGFEDTKLLERLRESALTEENMLEFMGALEKKGLNLITEYSKLLAEHVKLEKVDDKLNAQIEDLNNIIAYENANLMNANMNNNVVKVDCPDEILGFEKEPKEADEPLTFDKFRENAISSICKKLGQNNSGKVLNQKSKKPKVLSNRGEKK